jgi:uncharacterized protein (TIGR03435 family)
MARANVLCVAISGCWLLVAQSVVTKPEFEVVAIRPAAPPARKAGKGSQSDEAHLRYAGIPMQRLILNAYHIEDYQLAGPAWLKTERFEIDAKLPDGSTREQIPLMLQAMLAERFHFASHRENRQIPVFALVVAKGDPKMPPAQVRDSNVGVGLLSPTKRVFKGRTDIAELIFLLKVPGGDAALADRPILDMTGLKGLYDIRLEWTVDSAAPPGTSDADSAPTIFSALQDQLGLKLEPRKMPMEVLVVDRVDKVPTEN